MWQWLKDNANGLVMLVMALSIVGVLWVMSGCSLGDLIQVEVPRDVAKAIGTPSSIKLSQSDQAWEDWTAYVEKGSRQFSDNIADANYTFGVIQAFAQTGIEAGSTAALGLGPGGALIGTLLAFGGGLMLKKPGTDTTVRKEKEDSYNKGVEIGKRLAEEALRAANITKVETDPTA
jgi:hypothetical protein